MGDAAFDILALLRDHPLALSLPQELLSRQTPACQYSATAMFIIRPGQSIQALPLSQAALKYLPIPAILSGLSASIIATHQWPHLLLSAAHRLRAWAFQHAPLLPTPILAHLASVGDRDLRAWVFMRSKDIVASRAI